jgi:hypothetical protein
VEGSGRPEAASEPSASWRKSRRCMDGQRSKNLTGDFIIEDAEGTEKSEMKFLHLDQVAAGGGRGGQKGDEESGLSTHLVLIVQK